MIFNSKFIVLLTLSTVWLLNFKTIGMCFLN